METTKEIALMNCNNLDELFDVEFGKVGTPLRDEFDKEVQETLLSYENDRYVQRIARPNPQRCAD